MHVRLFAATFVVLAATAELNPTSQSDAPRLGGRYRLVLVGGSAVPARTRADLSDACWVETLSGSIEFRADGTYRQVETWRGGCDEAGRQRLMAGRGTTVVDLGRYSLMSDSLRLYSRNEGRWVQSTSGIVRGDSVFTGYDEDQIEMTYVRERRSIGKH